MGQRVAKPIERLLKIKTIDPNYVFVGADKKAYDEFIEKQKQETLLVELQEKEVRKTRRTKKIKQIIPENIIETGEIDFESE